MLPGETPTKSPALLRARSGKVTSSSQPALSPPLTSTCYNQTQQPANRDSGSSQQTRTQLRVAAVRVDLTTLRRSTIRLFVLWVFYKSAKQSSEPHALTPAAT